MLEDLMLKDLMLQIVGHLSPVAQLHHFGSPTGNNRSFFGDFRSNIGESGVRLESWV